jgi:fluoride exporter
MPDIPESLQRVLWVGLGGFLGANARYWLSLWVQSRWDTGFPWGTLVVNVSGSLLLGFLMTLLVQRASLPVAPALRLFFAVGLLGAYTTFSTFEYETFALLTAGERLRAAWNVLGSNLAGFAAVWIGVLLGRNV